jgi:hypothetical protein
LMSVEWQSSQRAGCDMVLPKGGYSSSLSG